MIISIAQIKPEKGNILRNINNHKEWIEIAAAEKADCIFFPELSLTAYEPELANSLATSPSDPLLDDFQRISDVHNISIGVGLPIKSEMGIFNSMVIFLQNKVRQTYSKQILHSDEEPYFISGVEQIMLTIKAERIAPAICYESLQKDHAKNAFQLGTHVYLASVAKSKKGIEKAFVHYPTIAKKYTMSVLMVNCVGFCDNFEAAGHSAIWDEKGNLMEHLDCHQEGLLIYDTKLKLTKTVSKTTYHTTMKSSTMK